MDVVIVFESAEWQGYTVEEYGEADAFGHRRKMSVAEDLSDEIKRTTGEEAVVSDLTYDLRFGSPDFVDRLVAFTFAGMAIDRSGPVLVQLRYQISLLGMRHLVPLHRT